MTFYSSLLCVGPRIWKRGHRLVARSGWKTRLLTLGLSNKELVVDPKAREVHLRRRRFWFWRRGTRIRFDTIAGVIYRYGDGSVRPWGGAGDTFDIYSVGLRLHGDEEVHLFAF